MARKPTSSTRHGNGAGWGGAAKGAGSDEPAHAPFEAGNALAVGMGEAQQAGRAAIKAAREKLEGKVGGAIDVWIAVMDDAGAPAAARVAAATKVVEHVLGTPIATNLTANVDDIADASDERIRSRIAELLGKSGVARAPG